MTGTSGSGLRPAAPGVAGDIVLGREPAGLSASGSATR
jgi:hypothetical protein